VDDLTDKVAVVTGGASGIGLALARRFLAEGARVVIGDVEEPALEKALAELDGEVRAVVCDVSQAADVERLARETIDAFGAVHILCNNAGVGGGGQIEQIPLQQWHWILGVNLWGTIHGIHYFVPHILEAGEGHVINTASIMGLIPSPMSGPYTVSKYGVVALAESLQLDLGMRGANVGVSVICPSWVSTNIHDAERNRPDHLRVGEPDAASEMGKRVFKAIIDKGLSAEEVAGQAVDAIRTKRFYVLPTDKNNELIRGRMEAILDGSPPKFSMPR
jgi:NAD(P)-dependent dehydrogenase (short-subunit alcohol dehydrogenase family)